MKKILGVLVVLMLLVGCSSTGSDQPDTQQPDTDANTVIDVFTRDSSSGTREAFEGGIGLGEGELTVEAVETSGNGDMASKVGADAKGIGYVSLTTDFAANNLKTLSFEGVEPTIENVLNQSYTLSRPFSYTARAADDFENDTVKGVVEAFLDFLNNSTEGLQAVEAQGGIVDLSNATDWSELSANHAVLDEDVSSITIRTAGSTSVEKTLQAALEAFQAETGVQFSMNHTGSGDGYKRVLGEEKDSANGADIGFASRDFKTDGSEEVSSALENGYYCLDAVVLVVSNDNTSSVQSLTAEQALSVFNGSITNWEDIK